MDSVDFSSSSDNVLRSKIISAVEKACGCDLSRLDIFLQRLEKNHYDREAAMAIFWHVYFQKNGGNEIGEDVGIKIEHLIQQEGIPPAEMENLAFITLCSTATLITAFINTPFLFNKQENFLNRGIKAIELLDLPADEYEVSEKLFGEIEESEEEASEWQSDDHYIYTSKLMRHMEKKRHLRFIKDIFLFSALAVSGIVNIEYALIYRDKARYDTAFMLYAEGAYNLMLSASKAILPHSGKPISEQEIVDLFESLRSSPPEDCNWEMVEQKCHSLHGVAHQEPFDYLCDGKLCDYLIKAAQYAKDQQNASEAEKRLYKERRQRCIEDLKRHFFSKGLWELLEDKTRSHMVDAMDAWLYAEEKGGDTSLMVEHLRLAIEAELHTIIDKALSSQLARASKIRIYSRKVAQILDNGKRGDSSVIKAIRALNLKEEDEKFLLERLPNFLEKVAKARNPVSHPENHKPPTKERLESIYQQALGIGQEGIIPGLASIKSSLRRNIV